MHNITLISTRHEKLGICDSQELYEILEALRPEVIFLELPSSHLNKRYEERVETSLETDAVRMYIDDHKPIIVAVDIDDIPDEVFFRVHRRALESVERLTDVSGYNYRRSVDTHRRYSANYGFNYLNSDHCITHCEAIKDATERGLEQINDEKLSKAYSVWVDLHERRENKMLQNIYDYSIVYEYNRAVFLLGSAHRKSIIEKINHRENIEALKLNWFLYCSEIAM